MSVQILRCSTCERDVHLSLDQPLYCPVCSDPLVEPAAGDGFALVTEPAPAGPDVYLG